MTSVKFEPARPDDRPALETLLTALRLPTDDLPADLNGFLLAFDKGVLVGSIGIERVGACALLRSFAVRENYRKAGLGRQLYEMALHFARDARFSELWLITDSADTYFERQGFERIERSNVPKDIGATAQFTALCPSSAVVMRKRI